jgi:transcriptional regulator with XRE-family HTH domain
MTSASFKKASVARLKNWLRRFSRMDIAPAQSKLFANPLRFHREAAGKTLGEVAKAADMKLSEVYNAERALHPEQETIDKILMAIATLRGYNFPLDNGYYAVDDSDVEDDDEYDDEFDDSDDDYEDEDDSELDDDDEDDDY